MAKKKAKEDFAAELAKDFERWDTLYTHGGSDPFWPDGAGLHLKRNHIMHGKRKISEQHPDGNYPEIFYRPTPPELPHDYMANPDKIRREAMQSLQVYYNDPYYQQLVMPEMQALVNGMKDEVPRNICRYVRALEHHIEHDDLVGMRRHRDPNCYVDSFEKGVRIVEQYISKHSIQLSLF